MNIEPIRAAIIATMTSIADIGHVHSFERYAAQEGDFRTLYLYNLGGGAKQIRGWYVRRVASRQIHSLQGVDDLHTWRIRGFRAIDDATQSEIAFDAHVEALRERFEAGITLADTVLTTIDENGDGVTLEESEPVLLAGVLCHSARLRLVTRNTHYD